MPPTRSSAALAALALSASLAAQQAPLTYPATKKVEHVDTYHGVTVPDPYRWLEDDNAPETAAWVEAQNKVTFSYLEAIPYRRAMAARLRALNNYERYSAPSRKAQYVFFRKNDGLQDQSVLYTQKGFEGTPVVLIDPNAWGTKASPVPLTVFSPSKDAKYAVYGKSPSGSDWQEYHVMELETQKTLEDTLQWVKVSNVAWAGDGFFYSRYPTPDQARAKAGINENHQVFFHKVGTPQSQDQLVYGDAANAQRFHIIETTEDERFAILSISERGKGKDGNALFVRDLSAGEKEFKPLIPDITNDSFGVVDNVGDKLLIATNKGAPNTRVVLIDPRQPAEANWKVVLRERPEPLETVTTAGASCLPPTSKT